MKQRTWKTLAGMAAVSCLCSGSFVFAEEKIEDSSLGISYTYTEEMESAGLTLYKIGITSENPYGEVSVYGGNVPLGVINVLSEEETQALLSGNDSVDSLTDIGKLSYPDFRIWEENYDGYNYLYLDGTEAMDLSGYEEEDAAIAEACLPYFQEFLDSIEYIPVVVESISDSPLTFETLNMDGETITEDILKEKDYTILNVWATYCNPCINEMPELAAWEKELPENVQILYLTSDIMKEDASQIGLAEKIVEKSGINRENVLYNLNDSFSKIMNAVTGVPTTFFIDRNGYVQEEFVVGADMESYKEILDSLL